MATLNTLLVNGNSVNGTRNWDTNQDFTGIDETIASADGSAIIDNTNASSAQVSSYLLSNVNSDFQAMLTLSVNIRRRVSGAQTNERTLGVRIVRESDGTVLAAADSGGTFKSFGIITNTTFGNTGASAFTYINTSANKAAWDDARIEFQNSVNKVHGGDSNGLQIDTVEITGTYTPGAVNYTLSASKGTFSLVGKSASLLANRYLGLSKGVFTLSGKEVDLIHTTASGYTILAGKGNFSLYRIM